MIHETSLSETVDDVNAAEFEGRTVASAERTRVARWIAARQGLPGAYSGTFAAFPRERAAGILLFTGERITNASARHIVGEEACRALRWLDVRDRAVQSALDRADTALMRWINIVSLDPRNTNPGRFCCGKCSVGMWRNLLSGGLDRQEERLRKGVGTLLHSHRDGAGKWRGFPFWYVVLALSEMDIRESRAELAYAAPALERAVKRVRPAARYPARRHALAGRALGVAQ